MEVLSCVVDPTDASSSIADTVVRYRDREAVALREGPEHYNIVVRRDEVEVNVTVPKTVLEWSVIVKDRGGSEVDDWCDYEGYEVTSTDILV